MLHFVDTGQQAPDKRPAAERIGDFGEIQVDFEATPAQRQAGRCSQCGIPFCQSKCPLHNNIPDWLKLAAEDRLAEAYEMAQATNSFPEICGRICPQDRLCEGACVIEPGFGTVTIGAIERHIVESAFQAGLVKPPRPLRELDKSVGIIGAGPGGLAAAEALRRSGLGVTVYDRHDRIGGLLVYGIPAFKLEKSVVARRAALLTEAGVEFRMNFALGVDASLDEIRDRHDAVLIATGVYRGRRLGGIGGGLEGIVPALDYLIASNRKGLGDAVPEFDDGGLNAAARHVVVIGGGDTAMDCVRTAVRQQARSVTCLYRRDRDNMPGSANEVRHAEQEGVRFCWLAAPEALLGDGRVSAVRAHRMRLGAADGDGRQQVVPVAGSTFTLDADLVIEALGFDPEDIPTLFGAPELQITPAGTISVDPHTMMTNLEGVFAAGDIVRGASLVVWAIRDGRAAAEAIGDFVLAENLPRPAAAPEWQR